jgi:XTP/dITP diphosphohydrolase
MPAIADDSGLVVDALGGKPGVYTSSYGGEGLTDRERCEFLLSKMVNKKERRARFVCTIVCAFPDGSLLTATGECVGEIAEEPQGTGGFGYDPIFIPDGKGKTMAALPLGDKNSISHRGTALLEFSNLLDSYKAGMRL